MTKRPLVTGFPSFILIWLGQVISLLGSELTGFALSVWVYQETNSVTQSALVTFFIMLPGILIAPLAGALVDRWHRRWAMIFSDVGAGVCTLLLALLFATERLEIWHIYVATAASSAFGAFRWPAFMATTTLLVPKQHLGRASGLVQLGQGIARIIAPLLAATLVARILVPGVMLIDVSTFLFAIVTLVIAHVPQPAGSTPEANSKGSLLREAGYGWVYLVQRPGLLGLLVLFAVANFSIGTVQVLITPLVLSFASVQTLGTVLSIAGSGLLVGSVLMAAWGGPTPRIYGILGFGFLQGLALFLGGMQTSIPLITAAAFVFLFTSPLILGCSQAIWQSKIPPDVQGRVFAMRQMIALSTSPLAYLLAGPLTDRVFNPLLTSEGPLAGSLGQLIGTGPQRGIGLFFSLLGLLIMLIIIAGYLYPRVRLVETELSDAVIELAPAPAEEQGSAGAFSS